MPEALPRVLMLATYFPKPLNPLMGNWALAQAQALRRNGVDILVASLTSWVPQFLALSRGARAYARCPDRFDWGGLPSVYPRWLYYQVGPARTLNRRYPGTAGAIGWWTAKAGLLSLARQFRPQLIYAHHTEVNGCVASLLQRKTGLPFLVTDHDFGEVESCRAFPARKRLFARVARQSSAMIAVSQRMEREIKSQFPFARTCTIPNGADPIPKAVLQNGRPAALRGKQVVFSCGTFYHRKGFPLLVDAFARVAAKFPNAELRVAGDGEERPEVEERIRQHGLASRVTLLGTLSHAEVIQEMVWCDVFALIGWDEPFATVYLEALSAAKPVLCCSDGGITDVVKNGEHGFTVPPRDAVAAAEALTLLLGSEELRRRFGAASLTLFETSLTWDRHARRMIDLFAGTLRRPAAVPQ
jgi:glycosyltransferase involved in cell wall biosynthesis